MNCADCRYWRRNQIENFDGGVYALTDLLPKKLKAEAIEFLRWGVCERMFEKDGKRADATTQAYASDYESYGACVNTVESFGCVMFERKP